MTKTQHIGAAIFLLGGLVSALAQTDLGTVDFGNVPVGLTNTTIWNWSGGASNGTNAVMQTAQILGPYASDFSATPSYQGQTLLFGDDYPTYWKFTPSTNSLETATMTNYETPDPPFGAFITRLQGTGVPATPATGPIVPALLPLQQAMTNYLTYHHFEAGTIALLYNDRLVLREGYGYRDNAYKQVIHPDNLFRLASVSKMLTASAIAKLVNDGAIATNTPVYQYLGIPPWGGTLGDPRITNITVQELLDHTGGWNYPSGGPEFDTIEISQQMGLDYPAAPTNVISWQFSKPLDFTPGTTNIYSNFGYLILGRVIEQASGMSYVDYIQNVLLTNSELFNPIGFTNLVQSRTRTRDLAPWEIWYTDWDTNLYQSAVDYPSNTLATETDGAFYYEAYDSFGGLSASAIGLCNYLRNYWESSVARATNEYYGWNYVFYGSLPGATSILYQNMSVTPSTTNGIEFAALFNQRDGLPDDNGDAEARIVAATTNITSWPTNGGGMVQWGMASTNVRKNVGTLTMSLTRTGASSLPVQVSYATYPVTSGSADFTPSSGIVTFAANQTNAVVSVPLLNNPANTTSNQFLLELLSASGGAWLGNQTTCVVNDMGFPQAPTRFTRVIFSEGFVQGYFTAPGGTVYEVQFSSDLVHWTSFQTVTNALGLVIIPYTPSKQGGTFCRLVVP